MYQKFYNILIGVSTRQSVRLIKCFDTGWSFVYMVPRYGSESEGIVVDDIILIVHNTYEFAIGKSERFHCSYSAPDLEGLYVS